MKCRHCGADLLPCPSCGAAADSLTPTELEVLRLFASGDYSIAEAARVRNCAHNTIKAHLWSIYHKLGVRSQSGMVVEAYRRGLASTVEPG